MVGSGVHNSAIKSPPLPIPDRLRMPTIPDRDAETKPDAPPDGKEELHATAVKTELFREPADEHQEPTPAWDSIQAEAPAGKALSRLAQLIN